MTIPVLIDMAVKKVLVLGNGNLCRSIITALCAHQSLYSTCDYKITVLTYPSQTLKLLSEISTIHLQHKTSDFTSPALQAAFTGHDIVISTVAGSDSELQIRIINAVIAAGVKRFIPHEFSHDSLNGQLQARLPKHAERANVISHLKSLSEGNPNLEWTAISTGYTLDANLLSGDMGFDMEWHSVTIHGTGTELFAASSLTRVGQVVARVIANWEKTKYQYIYAAGTVTSANEVLRAIEKATGQQFAVGHYGVEECIEEGQKRIERGYPDSGLALLERSVLYDKQLDASTPFRTHTTNDMLGLAAESVDAIVTEVYHSFRRLGKPSCGCSA
ncbi:hypothetical protein yc1106_05955 [Curvularia clavata]|uniref:NmrA-like domain-containing protein n=1 Tax=Curvularia clavata TaxID=95742 RepID=A0A9Q9DUR2_CURCL|nr:hypothetical protein yc1106_05955 [Curvularia clavata]